MGHHETQGAGKVDVLLSLRDHRRLQPVREAMGAGKVVLAAANEDTYGPEVLKNGRNIVLVEPGNPRQLARTIIELLSDEERCRAIGNEAYQTIKEHFSWDSVCDRTLDLYREVLRRGAQ